MIAHEGITAQLAKSYRNRKNRKGIIVTDKITPGGRRHHRLLGAAMAATVIASINVAAPAAHAGTIFQTIDNPADPTFNQLFGINNAGTIVGAYGNSSPGHPNKGYAVTAPYAAGNFTGENFPGSVQTQVVSINNTGTSVGYWYNTGDSTSNNNGFVDVNGAFTNVNNPLTNGVPSINQLLGVNDKNIAAGYYQSGGMTFGYTYNIATKTFTPVTVANGTNVFAAGINNSGAIDGYYTNSSGAQLGFLIANGILTSLQAPGFASTQLLGLNNDGLLVGIGISASGTTSGIVYNSGSGVWNAYNDPFGTGATAFNGVNDLNQVVGFYTDSQGNTHGLLATQVPEPGSLPLLASAILGLAVARRKRPPI